MIVYDGRRLADASGGTDALIGAVTWIEAALMGTVATTIAVIAIATVGFSMLTGRLAIRRGATVILGCFILFGAASIASGLRGLALGPSVPAPASSNAPALQSLQLQAETLASSPPPAPADPYAGAAVRR